MHENPYSPSALELQTPGDAKAALLDWSVQADAELLAQIHEFVGSVKAKARRVTPWAAGAALFTGVLFGRRRKRGRGSEEGAEPSRSGRFFSILRIALDLVPIILPLLRRR